MFANMNPTLIVDRDIASFDIYAEMYDSEQPVFSATTVQDFLDKNKDATGIDIEIRSDGGSTSEARIIYDILKNSGKKITTKGFKVNSSAMVIFLAGDERLISDNADSIIHPVAIDPWNLGGMLTAEDLTMFAEQVEEEQGRLLDIYIESIGEDNRVEVAQMMADTTNLGSADAIRLGFATGSLTAPKTENKRSIVMTNKMAKAVINNKNKKNDMDIIQELKNIVKGLKNETPPVTTNASVALADESTMYFDGTLAEGTMVFSDEAMETAQGDGDVVLGDGRTVTVKGGAVESIEDAVEEENTEAIDAVNAKVAGLEKMVEDGFKTINEGFEAINKGNEANATAIAEFKNHVQGDNKKVAKVEIPVKYEDMTNLQKMNHNKGL